MSGNGKLNTFFCSLSLKPTRQRNAFLDRAAELDYLGLGWSTRTWRNQYYSFAKGDAVGTRKQRSDVGDLKKWDAFDEATQDEFLYFRKESQHISTRAILEMLIDKGTVKEGDISVATLNRVFKRYGLSRKQLAERRIVFPFGWDHANDCWQIDHSSSTIRLRIPMEDGKVAKVQPDLFLIIDDRSRVCWGMYTLGHRTEHVNYALATAMEPKHGAFYSEEGLHVMRGVPSLVYADKGSSIHNDQTRANLGRVGCTLLETLAEMPTARGKVENRFGQTLKKPFEEKIHLTYGKRKKKAAMDLHPHLSEADPKARYEGLTLEDLNRLFWKELLSYNARPSSALGGKAPNEAYLATLEKVREVVTGDAEANHFALVGNFMLRAEQKVSSWGTVTIRQACQIGGEKITHKHEFRAPDYLAGRAVIVLYDHAMTDWVWIGVKDHTGKEKMAGVARRTTKTALSGIGRAQQEARIAEAERMRRPRQVDDDFVPQGDFVKQIAGAVHNPLAIPEVERVKVEPVQLDVPERPEASSQMELQSIVRGALGRNLTADENAALVAFHGDAGHIPGQELKMHFEMIAAEIGTEQALPEYFDVLLRRYGLVQLNTGRATG